MTEITPCAFFFFPNCFVLVVRRRDAFLWRRGCTFALCQFVVVSYTLEITFFFTGDMGMG